MSTVRAKFTCHSLVEHANGQLQYSFHPVYSSTGENASFSRATPGGDVQLVIDPGTQAHTFFERGKSYYLDFTEAPAE